MQSKVIRNLKITNRFKYYKVTNKHENHHGFQYIDGLNILKGKFENDPDNSCGSGGFYFTTLEYIPKFYSYGTNIRQISLPESDPDFLMVKDPSGSKWRANKIILGEKYSLLDPSTYKKLNLDITEYKYLIDYASENGRLDTLEWWKKSDIKLIYSHLAIDLASGNGHSNILDWWKKSGLELKYKNSAIKRASANGHSIILDWWKNSGLELKYTNDAIDNASMNGHIDVLEWWKNSGLEIKYTNDAIIWASKNGQSNILGWWLKSDLVNDCLE